MPKQSSGNAIVLYRPIHREVSRKSTGAKSDSDLLPKGGFSFTENVKSFLKGDDSEKDNIRNSVQSAVKNNVAIATNKHATLVLNEYRKEIKNVKDANEDQAKDKAAAKMQKIIDKVRDNLITARGDSSNIFS